MIVVVLNLGSLTEANTEIIVHRLVVQEIFLDHVSAIAKAQHEIAKPVVRVQLHDVPENRTPTHVHQRLWPELGLFAQAGAQSAAKNNYLHLRIMLRMQNGKVWITSGCLLPAFPSGSAACPASGLTFLSWINTEIRLPFLVSII